jgi:hypothetical protein
VAGIGLETGRKVTNAVEQRVRGADAPPPPEVQARRKRRLALAVGIFSLVGLVLVGAALLKVLAWVLGVAFLAGLGYAAWYFIGPKIRARIEARRARRQEVRSRREARRAQERRQARIDDELQALKRKAGEQ